MESTHWFDDLIEVKTGDNSSSGLSRSSNGSSIRKLWPVRLGLGSQLAAKPIRSGFLVLGFWVFSHCINRGSFSSIRMEILCWSFSAKIVRMTLNFAQGCRGAYAIDFEYPYPYSWALDVI